MAAGWPVNAMKYVLVSVCMQYEHFHTSHYSRLSIRLGVGQCEHMASGTPRLLHISELQKFYHLVVMGFTHLI